MVSQDRTPKIDTKTLIGMYACWKTSRTSNYQCSEIISTTPARLTLNNGETAYYSRGSWHISVSKYMVNIRSADVVDAYIQEENNKICVDKILTDFGYDIKRSRKVDEALLDELRKHLQSFLA